MDFNSGSLPLEFIRFYLDMASEEQITESTLSITEGSEATRGTGDVSKNPVVTPRPDSNQSTSSGNTEESLTTYAEQTLRTLAAGDPSLDISFLPTPTENPYPEKDTSIKPGAPVSNEPQKASDELQADPTREQGTSSCFVNKQTTALDKSKDYFATDTSEVEELYDSMGAEGIQNRSTSNIVGSDLLSIPNDIPVSSKGTTEEIPAGLEVKEPKLPEQKQFSANGRAELRKHFTTAPPIVLPKGHTTVSFSEFQIHAVLKTISDETVKSSIHAMRSLVMHAVYGEGHQTPSQFRKGMIRGATPARRVSTSSEGEPESGGYSTDENTSGAITSDEEFYAQTEGRCSTPGPRPPAMQLPIESSHTNLACNTVPSPGYSEGDYVPLSETHSDSRRRSSETSPPKKKRKLAGKPGKVMKPAYFKGIQWTKIFVTGLLDPVHNKHKFYSQICKTNVSIYSKGTREIIRHYQSEARLRKHQRWRLEHLGQIDKLTGLTVHAVRGKDGRVLSALDLEKEKPLFLTAPLVDIGPRFPFYEDYMAGVGGLKHPEDVRLATQISLIGRLIPYFGNLTILEGLWIEVGNSTNHQDTFRQLDWGSLTLTVSIVSIHSFDCSN